MKHKNLIIAVLLFLFNVACTHQKQTDETGILNISTLDSIVEQEHIYTDLSSNFDYKLIYTESYSNKEVIAHYWTILVHDKNNKLLDSIHQPSYELYSENIQFDKVRSYSTGLNNDTENTDNYFGDFIVGDFNFDTRDDFAIINDIGGNGGTLYSYYIQQVDGRYILDHFLTDTMVYFPSRIDKTQKTLTNYVHAGACYLDENTYQFTCNKWIKKTSIAYDVCNNSQKSN